LIDLLQAFADGELDHHQNKIIADHLMACNWCQNKLHNYILFSAKMRQLNPQTIEDKLGDAIDDLITTITSLEQQGIFALLTDGVTFSRIKLYRKIEPMEQGALVDDKVAFSVSLQWPTLQEMLYKSKPTMVVVELLFFEPFEHLNIR
jgi:hypothetical protein